MGESERERAEASRKGQERAIANEQRERADGHSRKQANRVIAGLRTDWSRLVPRPGGGGLFEVSKQGRAGKRGSGEKEKEIANGSEPQLTSVSDGSMEAKRSNIPYSTASRSAPRPSCRPSGRFLIWREWDSSNNFKQF